MSGLCWTVSPLLKGPWWPSRSLGVDTGLAVREAGVLTDPPVNIILSLLSRRLGTVSARHAHKYCVTSRVDLEEF